MSESIRQRYFAHLVKHCCSVPASHRFVMLSGGIDSFTLLAALMQTHKPSDVTAMNVGGVSTYDYAKAVEAARYFGIKQVVRRVCMNDILENVRVCSGTTDNSVFQLVFRVSCNLLFKDHPITGCAVYQGDGADSLYGNSSSFVYMRTAEVAKQKRITVVAAREILRREYRAKMIFGKKIGTALLVSQTIKQFGGTPVLPWMSGEFEYVLDVPLKAFRGDKKQWVRDGLISEWGISRSVVDSRRRCSMQDGLGYYRLICKELCQTYRTSTPNAAVRMIARGLA